MGKFPVSLIYYLGLLVTIIGQGTQGLKCYQCRYLNHDGQNSTTNHGDCLSAMTPKSPYLIDCNSDSRGVKLLSQNNDGSIGLRDADELIIPAPNITKSACYSYSVEGTYLGKKRTFIERNCVLYYKHLKRQCTTKTVKKWKDADDLWSYWTFTDLLGFAEDDEVHSCYCTRDYCNSAPSTSLSVAVLVGATAFAYIKQMYLQ